MNGVSWAPYARSLREPFVYGNRTVATREGLVLRARKFETFVYAEASPLPGHSRDSIEDAIAWLKSAADQPPPPAVAWGLESLACVHAMEGSRLSFPVESSALLRWQGTDRTTAAWRGLLQRGFRTFKLKVPSGNVGEVVDFLASAPPERQFRLDANQALDANDFALLSARWPSVRERVQYIEEPGSGWEGPCAALGIPTAVDESAADPANWPRLFSRPSPPAALIAKPMVNGSVREWPSAASVIFGSTLEAEPGRRALIAWLGSDARRTRLPAGLATGSLLRDAYFPDLARYEHLPEVSAEERRWLDSLSWRELRP